MTFALHTPDCFSWLVFIVYMFTLMVWNCCLPVSAVVPPSDTGSYLKYLAHSFCKLFVTFHDWSSVFCGMY